MLTVVDIKNRDSSVFNEALLNECKGNLFEYLVGQSLARHYNIEGQFYKNISSEYRSTLSLYERRLKDIAPDLIKLLPVQANSVCQSLEKFLPKKANSLWVIGKANCKLELDKWNEADILVKSNDDIYPISLKLTKWGSYINTKSAGVKSFISKYFSVFDDSQLIQDNLNKLVDMNFINMTRSLYDAAGFEEFDDDFSYWKAQGLPELPGSLPEELKEVVTSSYIPLGRFIYESFNILYKKDKEKFLYCLMPLLGLSGKDIIQAVLYHKAHRDYKLQVEKKCHIFTSVELKNEFHCLKFRNSTQNHGYFYLDFIHFTLQVRIKPMNKFTSKSFKINCSVKHHI